MTPRGPLLLLVAGCAAFSAAPASAAGNLLQSLVGSGGGAGSLVGPLASSLFGGSSSAPSLTYVMAPSVSYGYAPPPPRLPPPPSVTRYLPPPPSIGAPPMRAPSAYAPPPPPQPAPEPASASLPLQSASRSIAAARQVKECRHGQWSGENGQLVVGTACLGPDGWVLY